MVDKQFGVDAEEFVEQTLLGQRAACHVAHGPHAAGFELAGDTASHAPKIGERAVVPQLPAVRHLVKLSNAHAVLVGRDVLGDDIHSHLAEVEVGADAGGGGDARLAQHVANHAARQLMGGYLVSTQVVGDIHEDFVDRIDVDVLGGDVLHVDAENAGAIVDVIGHAGWCHMVGDGQFGVGFQFVVVGRLAGELPVGGFFPSFVVHLSHTLHHLEQTGASPDAVLFQRGCHRQTDGLLRAALVGHYQVGGQGVETPLDALHRGVERLEVDGDICALLFHDATKRERQRYRNIVIFCLYLHSEKKRELWTKN